MGETVNKPTVRKIDMRRAYSNQMRFMEEVARGLHGLLKDDERPRTWLAKRLGVSNAYVSKILGDSPQNFTLAKLADISYAFDRSVHLVFGDDPDGMRMPFDEVAAARVANKSSTEGAYSYSFVAHVESLKAPPIVPAAGNQNVCEAIGA